MDVFGFVIPFTILFDAVLFVATGVSGCGWPIYDRAVFMYVSFYQFSTNPPNYASVADAMTFIIILNYTCTGQFSGGIVCIGVLDFCPRKKNPPALLCDSVVICRVHPNKCG